MTTRSRRSLTLAASVLTVSALAFWSVRMPSAPSVKSTSAAPGFAFYLLRGQSTPNEAMLADASLRDSADSLAGPECRALWSEVMLLDLTPFLESTRRSAPTTGVLTLRLLHGEAVQERFREILSRRGCPDLPDSVAFTAMREATTRLKQTCESSSAVACVTAGIWLRLHATRYLTRHFALSDIRDVGTLVHLLFANTLAGDTTDAPDAAAIADRILELSPRLVDASRAAAQLRYVDFVWNHTHPPAAEALESALLDAEAAETLLHEKSALLAELRVAEARAREDWILWAKRAAELRERFPSSGSGSYYLGWLAYRQGDRAKAATYVREAFQREMPTPSTRVMAAFRKFADSQWRGTASEAFRDDAGGFGFVVKEEGRRPSSVNGLLPLSFLSMDSVPFGYLAGW